MDGDASSLRAGFNCCFVPLIVHGVFPFRADLRNKNAPISFYARKHISYIIMMQIRVFFIGGIMERFIVACNSIPYHFWMD